MALEDLQTESKIIGSILLNNELVEDDEFPLSPEYFNSRLSIICYSAIYNLFKNGLREITKFHISNYLQKFQEQFDYYNAAKGDEFLDGCLNVVELSNYEYYYTRLKKFAILRDLSRMGFDISPIYNEFEDNPICMASMLERFDNAKPEEIVNYFNNITNTVESKYEATITMKGGHAAEGLEEYFESLKEAPEVGLSLNGNILNAITRGARLQKFYIKSAATGVGKAIPNDTLLPTYNKGLISIQDIQVGDLLIDKHGNPTRVLAVYPQKNLKEVYEITFKDGRIAKCCDEHLWSYLYNTRKGQSTGIKTCSLKEMIQISKKYAKKYQKNDGTYIFKVPLCEPIKWPAQKLKIDPYVLGLFLGDGCFSLYDGPGTVLSYSSNNSELPNNIAKIMGWEAVKQRSNNYTYIFKYTDDNHKHKNVQIRDFLIGYPDLIGTKSESKFIPDEYKFGSVEQRLSLLQGLLDSDGSIDEAGRISYTTINKHLKNDIIFICQSLGFIVTVNVDKRHEKYTTSECFSLKIQVSKEFKPQLFRLSYKHKIAIDYFNNNKRSECKKYNPIVDIRATGTYANMTCLTVDNEDGLFLMNDFIVTHNTRTLAATAAQISVGEYYDIFKKQWIKVNEPQSALFTTAEQSLQDIQTIVLAFVSGVDERKIINRTESDEERARIMRAITLIKASNLHIVPIGNYSIKSLTNVIKKYKYQQNIRYLFHDYLQSSINLMSDVSGLSKIGNLREDQLLLMLSTTLKDLSNKFNLFTMTSTQLNRSYKTEEELDATVIRGALSISDKADFGCIMNDISPEELDLVASINANNQLAYQPTTVTSVYKNRSNPYVRIKIYSHLDKATGQCLDLFALDQYNNVVNIQPTQIIQK